jgi:Alginate lyase
MPSRWPCLTRCPAVLLALLAALALVRAAATSPAVASTARSLAARTAMSRSPMPGCRSRRGWIVVGGACRWVTVLRFRLPAAGAARATLRLYPRRAPGASLRLRAAGGATVVGRRHGRGTVAIEVGRLLRPGARRLALTITSRSRRKIELVRSGRRAPRLELVAPAAPLGPGATAPPSPAPAPAPPPPPAGGAPGSATPSPAPPAASGAVWVSRAELASRPMSGPAWDALEAAADGPLGTAAIADQDSGHDVRTLAVALVFARTGDPAYRAKAAEAIAAAIGTEAGGRTLALGRNLAPYVIAADLIDLRHSDPALDARFRAWLQDVRTELLDGRTLISTHEQRPNNWGTMAGASRIAVALYLGDGTDLERAATVFRGYLGDRSAYASFAFGELSWQADPAAPVGVNPPGASRAGLDIGGALPDDMRRGCSFTLPPCHTGYAWEALQGVLLQAELLSRHGYPAYRWGQDAILRAALFLERLDRLYGGWWADGDDSWQPWVINHAYGTSFPAAAPARHGKILGWTDWMYGR